MKIKKQILLFIIIVIIMFLVIVNLFKKKSYEVEYNINGYDVTENYNKDKKVYLFTVKNNQLEHSFFTTNNNREHKLITEIETIELEEEQCLKIKSPFLETNPLCSINGNAIDFRLTSKEMQEKLNYNNNIEDLNQKYNNILINNPLNYTYLVWNYKGFDIINKYKQYNINILSKDQYSLELVYLLKNYLVIADYDSDYT